jgi:hypothetical protein
MINIKLAQVRGLTNAEIAKVESLQLFRKSLEKQMKETPIDDVIKQHQLFKAWKENEFKLQELWKFEINSTYHKDYLLTHCCCPTMDNHLHWLSKSGLRSINYNCIYHGKGYDSKNIQIEKVI